MAAVNAGSMDISINKILLVRPYMIEGGQIVDHVHKLASEGWYFASIDGLAVPDGKGGEKTGFFGYGTAKVNTEKIVKIVELVVANRL